MTSKCSPLLSVTTGEPLICQSLRLTTKASNRGRGIFRSHDILRFEQQLRNMSKTCLAPRLPLQQSQRVRGLSVPLRSKQEGLLRDLNGSDQAFCSRASHLAKAFPRRSLTPTQHPTFTPPQTSDSRWSLTADRKACQPEQGCFVPFVAVPHRLIKRPAWSGTPQT